MKKTFLVLCATFAIGSVGFVGAEQYGSGQSTSSKKSDNSARSSREVTLTGCLEQGSSPNEFVLRNATESEGGSSSSSSQMSGSSSQGTSGSSSEGTSGSSNSGMSAQGTSGSQGEQSAMDFQLVGKSKELKKFVGQRIEVRGKVEPMRENQSGMSSQSGTSGAATSGETGGAAGTSGTSGTQSGGSMGGSQSGGSMSGQSTTAGAVTHRVKVNSVKQLSSSCQ